MNERELTLTIPVGEGSVITVEGVFPISLEEWRQFVHVLDSMKPGLVRE